MTNEKNELTVDESPSGHLHETPMVIELGEDFGLEPKQIVKVLRSIVKVPRGAPPATAAELIIVLSVMRQYKMNPMMKQLHAWRDGQGELALMPGYDFWTQKALEQPGYKGASYRFGPEVPSPDGKGQTAWEWVEVTIHDHHRGDIVMFPVYLKEWYKKQGNYPGPWQKQTKHKMHVLPFRLAIREYAGIGLDVRDPGDFDQAPADPAAATAGKLADMAAGAVYEDAEATVEDAEPPEVPCGAGGCGKAGLSACGVCNAYFCEDHLNDSNECAVCTLDS